MSNFTISPNMNLPMPIPGVDPGPDYANNQNSAFTIIDGHTHSAGSGVQITPSGLNINSNLAINSNNLTLVNTVNFKANVSSLAGTSPNLGCVYVGGNELYYNDEAGNVVAITNNGSVNAGAGSITGLPSGTASASYSSGSGTFVWRSATNTPANTDTGSIVLRNNTASSHGLTLSPTNALAADYSLVLPLVPGTTSLLSLDTSGNFSTTMTAALANSVGTAMTATGANAVANTRTRALGTSVAAGGVALSASSGAFSTSNTSPTNVPNLSVTITTTGRPVFVGLINDGNGTSADFIQIGSVGTNISIGTLEILNGSTVVCNSLLSNEGATNGGTLITAWPSSSFHFVDTTINGTPGTYTYVVKAFVSSASYGITVQNAKLIAYEI